MRRKEPILCKDRLFSILFLRYYKRTRFIKTEGRIRVITAYNFARLFSVEIALTKNPYDLIALYERILEPLPRLASN